MAVNQDNKILAPAKGGTYVEGPNGETLAVSDSGLASADGVESSTFQYSQTQAEFMDTLYLGTGPHEKRRSIMKVMDKVPYRVTQSNPEVWFDQTYVVYWNSGWKNPKVFIQADATESFNPKQAFSLDGGTVILWDVTGQGSGSGSWTYALSTYYRDLTSIFTSGGTGYYNVRIRFRGTTGCYTATPIYLAGTAPKATPWVGTPNVDGSGLISFDMTISMPEIIGVDDWDVEIAEL